ncbi:pyridoxal phosphate-dependent aminotransferase [Fluoribacter gormanii]|uniref:pyridoxal phosphate-dependent aminotransferase n=1 Tax=Fluoribacter gormanii TaxID=464 RepID=UPI001041275D|nr:pyridoxal phosphate-dependent aminotransferase [Fluoribacter gormanii]
MLLSNMDSEWDIDAITEYCQKINGIDLGQGVSSLPVPEEMLVGIDNTLLDELSHQYSSPKGIGNLRKMIANKFHHFNQIIVDPETEVIITHGATGALVCAIKTLFNPGDEVLLFEPFYPAHRSLLEFFGVNVKLVPIRLSDLSFDLESLEQSISSKTRGLLLCNPANPLGKVFQKNELNVISMIVEKYNLNVISDEIYEYITYDTYQHVSFARLGNNKSRTITISGFSKTYNTTGWRLGYAAGPSTIIKQMTKIQELLYVCPVTPLQYAAKSVIFLQKSYYKNLIQFYQKQRDIVISTFIEFGFKPIMPQGAYYALIDISTGLNDDETASKQFLQKAKIATIPGRIFFTSDIGKKYIRVCFAKSVHRLPKILLTDKQLISQRS